MDTTQKNREQPARRPRQQASQETGRVPRQQAPQQPGHSGFPEQFWLWALPYGSHSGFPEHSWFWTLPSGPHSGPWASSAPAAGQGPGGLPFPAFWYLMPACSAIR